MEHTKHVSQILNKMSKKNLDVILIGESNHTDLKQAYEIAKIIIKYKPEYVLCEGFNKKISPSF